MSGIYPKKEYVGKGTSTVLQCTRKGDKTIEYPRAQPGNIIIVHGVNDVGTGYREVEEGLCAGLEKRLSRCFKSGRYSMPTDKNKVVEDPDAVYFKRTVSADTDSPVIPFYWGFREVKAFSKSVNGQKIDRYGNRLDKDLSKGGGPFGNATSTLPDMWNRGVGVLADPMRDPLRPLRDGPGRMYMVLAARRLAALVAMIRDYGKDETVTIVAHSQGCLLSLLAQAFLMDQGERTADTLILTHPPYSLEEDVNWQADGVNMFSGGTDAPMAGLYGRIDGLQSLHGRLQTLVNIVKAVAQAKATTPAFASISEWSDSGMVEARWTPESDRDNRGKVYLYFCPEDMTVALENMVGIGWQGVPDQIKGTKTVLQQVRKKLGRGSDYDIVTRMESVRTTVTRMPLKELGDSFRQRVFTAKPRFDPQSRKTAPVLVGMTPHDFALRIRGEDDHAHVAKGGRTFRASHQVAKWPIDPGDGPEAQRLGIRRINGEALAKPCLADMRGSQIDADKLPAHSLESRVAATDRGPCEEVDPVTAAIAISSSNGLKIVPVERPDPSGKVSYPGIQEPLARSDLDRIEAAYNRELNPKGITEENKFKVISALRYPDGKVVARIQESRDAARRRWQNDISAKSFHSAIFDSRKNHEQVTAYDVAIGRGKASTDPNFYKYLCAVADWRLKGPGSKDKPRPEILTWEKFMTEHGIYFKCEPTWRSELIDGNMKYYSSGFLPACLPKLMGKILDILVVETTSGVRTENPYASKENV